MRRAVLGILLRVLVVLIVGEAVCRFLPRAALPVDPMGTLMEPHPTRGWWMKPGEASSAGVPVRIDADGVRISVTRGEGPLVLMVGDSTWFGHGLRDGDTIHDQLQVDLGGAVNVRTAAVPGYSTLQVRRALDETLWDLHPKLLIVGSLWSDNNLDVFRDADLLARMSAPGARAERVLSQSALFYQARRGVFGLIGGTPTWSIGWVPNATTGQRRVPLSDYAANLDAIYAGAASRGIGVLAVSPANREIVAGQFVALWGPYFEELRALTAARKVALVEVGDVLKATGAAPETLFLDQMHPSKVGAAAIAAAMAAAIQARGLDHMVPDMAGAAPTVPADPYARGTLDPHSLPVQMVLEAAG